MKKALAILAILAAMPGAAYAQTAAKNEPAIPLNPKFCENMKNPDYRNELIAVTSNLLQTAKIDAEMAKKGFNPFVVNGGNADTDGAKNANLDLVATIERMYLQIQSQINACLDGK